MDWRRAKRLGTIAIVITSLVTCLSGLFPYLQNKGWFEQWQPLGYPPGKAIKILAGKGNFPFVETTEGEFYVCFEALPDNGESCWVKENSSPEPTDAFPCSAPLSDVDFHIPNPPGEVIDKVEFQSCEGGVWTATRQHHFVLLADGSVWVWQHADTALVEILTVLGTIGGFSLGLIISTIVIIIVSLYEAKGRSRTPRHTLPGTQHAKSA